MADKELEITRKEITDLDVVARDIVIYSEDDRRKADDLFNYYQELIAKGDTKGETREALAKTLELRENAVNNIVEILKLKTRLIEKKLALDMKRQMNEGDNNMNGYQRRSGYDTSTLIAEIDAKEKGNG